MDTERIEKLEKCIGYSFKDKKLLLMALTHSSYSNEMKMNNYGNYERIEFLGDAVLELTSSEFFYNEFPKLNEGALTRLRASMVCEQALAFCARQFGLQEFIYLGKGEEATGGRNRDSIIADVFEAVLGAIYIDGGLEPASRFVKERVLTDLENKKMFYDAKTILQERVQKDCGSLSYVLVSESGPDHDKLFCVNAVINGKTEGYGEGKSKKQAEQQAAYAVLTK